MALGLAERVLSSATAILQMQLGSSLQTIADLEYFTPRIATNEVTTSPPLVIVRRNEMIYRKISSLEAGIL